MSFLYDCKGNRKYLTASERRDFVTAAHALPDAAERTFCSILVYTGMRLSEGLALTHGQIDFDDCVVVIRSLKKRRDGIFRAVPLPSALLAALDATHGVRAAQTSCERRDERLWPWCRTVGWQTVKRAMRAARIDGVQATPKGLRHGFAVGALQNGVPINIVSRWLGHANLRTTAIYAEAVGAEERSFAQRMWSAFKFDPPSNDGGASFPDTETEDLSSPY